MATAQSSADKKTVGMITEVDAEDFVYTAIGGIRFYTGQGAPDHTTGIKGCLYCDTDAGKLYVDTDGAGTWAEAT